LVVNADVYFLRELLVYYERENRTNEPPHCIAKTTRITKKKTKQLLLLLSSLDSAAIVIKLFTLNGTEIFIINDRVIINLLYLHLTYLLFTPSPTQTRF
jgi:hypothetical protein